MMTASPIQANINSLQRTGGGYTPGQNVSLAPLSLFASGGALDLARSLP